MRAETGWKQRKTHRNTSNGRKQTKQFSCEPIIHCSASKTSSDAQICEHASLVSHNTFRMHNEPACVLGFELLQGNIRVAVNDSSSADKESASKIQNLTLIEYSANQRERAYCFICCMISSSNAPISCTISRMAFSCSPHVCNTAQEILKV
jgi:hypothetical protein